MVTEHINLRVSSSNQRHLEEHGYVLPKKWSVSNQKFVVPTGTVLLVNINDLQPTSNVKICYQCDSCGQLVELNYHRYTAKKQNLDLCFKCSCTINCNLPHRFGSDNPNWNSNKTDIDRVQDRSTLDYMNFVNECLVRDNYTCQLSGIRGGKLAVHHIYSYAKYPELRTDPNNGITIRKDIHDQFHKQYGKVKFTAENFERFKENYACQM